MNSSVPTSSPAKPSKISADFELVQGINQAAELCDEYAKMYPEATDIFMRIKAAATAPLIARMLRGEPNG